MRVRPSRPGLIVGFPGRPTPLAQGGEEVPRTAYWIRRLRCGDVVAAELEASSPPDPDPPEARRPRRRPRRDPSSD